MASLFDNLEPPSSLRSHHWIPQEPPCLDNIHDIQLNFETDGLKWWAGDKPIAASLCIPDGRTWYLPWGHQGGGNLDEVVVHRWFKEQVKLKRITNTNARFDVHMGRVWDVDFEEQGCVWSDVSHYAALLDDKRVRFNLDLLIEDFIGPIEIPRLDESRMATYHAGEVEARSRYNVLSVKRLRDLMWPMLDEQGLQKVRLLEDSLIYVVCEMEKNGTKIDIDLLDRWLAEVDKELETLKMDIYRETGLAINPGSSDDMERLFHHLKLPVARTDLGRPSFTTDILRPIDHPIVKKAFRWRKASTAKSKYLLPYAKTVDRSTGILRYALHQLRAQKDEFDESSGAGTISGRFASTKLLTKGRGSDEDVGMNIQNIIKPEKQRIMFGLDEEDDSHDDELYIVRQLHIPEIGQHLSADAMQIEYRLFAHETNSPRLLNIYTENPLASFHKKTHAMLKTFIPTLDYRRGKDVNFAYVYGAGVRKMGFMLRYLSKEQYSALLNNPNWWNSPLLAEVKEIRAIYNREIPEVAPLIERCQNLAKNRGYIKSILGRRVRFPNGERSHKALNSRIQMSAAEIMKVKLVELHRQRRETGFVLRYTVHDECDGDATGGEETARKVSDILNFQSFNLRVPIRWEVSIGPNWKQVSKMKEDDFVSAHEVDPNRIHRNS